MNFSNIKEMQKKLNTSKKMIADLDTKFKEHDTNIKYKKLNDEYKKYCSKFSPAYLSGSPWYVGENLFDSNKNKYILNFAFLYGCAISK